MQNIKQAVTKKLKKLNKKTTRLQPTTNIIPNTKKITQPPPYSFQSSPIPKHIISPHSLASSSTHQSSCSSSFSFQDCSTIFDSTTHQLSIQLPDPIPPLQQYLPHSLPSESSTSYSSTSSNTIHFNNDYPVATSKEIQQLIYMDTQKTKTNQ